MQKERESMCLHITIELVNLHPYYPTRLWPAVALWIVNFGGRPSIYSLLTLFLPMNAWKS